LKAPFFFALLACVACSKPDAAPRRTEPWLAHPSSSASPTDGSAPRRYRFTSDSSIRFSTNGRKGKVSGKLAVGSGQLQLDPRDLKQTRASVDVDLTTLSVDATPPDDLQLGGSPSAVALQWLGLGPSVPSEQRTPFMTARFELATVENATPPYVELGSKRRQVTRATVVGTLLLHGFRAPVRVDVAVSETEPGRISIRSLGPLVLPLADHDITARGADGVRDALAAARSVDWVGKQARVELELVAVADTNP